MSEHYPKDHEKIFDTPNPSTAFGVYRPASGGPVPRSPGGPAWNRVQKRTLSAGACLTMVAKWMKCEMRGPVFRFDQLGPTGALHIAHARYKMDETDHMKTERPFEIFGLKKTLMQVVENDEELGDFLTWFYEFVPGEKIYMRMDMWAGGGGHTVGFIIEPGEPGNGKYLEPNTGAWEFKSYKRAKMALSDVIWEAWQASEARVGEGGERTFYFSDVEAE